MLRKLLKYEIKATARLFLPLYLVVLLFAFVNKLINPFKLIEASSNLNFQVALSMLSIIVYFALVVGIIAMTIIIMIQRFYKSLLGDEGYLMFTLPVKSWEHVVSKLLVSMLWTVLSFIAVACSILILVFEKGIWSELSNLINTLRIYVGNIGFFLIPANALVSIAFYIITIYTAITLGHLLPKHKIMASFGMYIVLYFISQMVLGIFVLLSMNTILAPLINSSIPTPYQLNMLITCGIGVFLILIASYFILTNIILKKRLNLE